MNNAEKIKEWSKKISEFSKSGKSKQDWCKENNITSQQFGYWNNRVPSEKQTTQWLPVKIEENEVNNKTASLQDEELPITPLNIKVGVASIEIHRGFDKGLLLDVLKTLKSL